MLISVSTVFYNELSQWQYGNFKACSHFFFHLTPCKETVAISDQEVKCQRRFIVGWPVRFGRFYRNFIIIYISKASKIPCDADELLQCDRTSKPVMCSCNPHGRNTRVFMKLMQKYLVTKHSQGFHISGLDGNRNSWI